jgi:hypothetical protein
MGKDVDGTNGYVGTDGSGRYGYVGADVSGGYWYVGTDMIAKKIVNQKLDFDYRSTFLSGGEKKFLY